MLSNSILKNEKYKSSFFLFFFPLCSIKVSQDLLSYQESSTLRFVQTLANTIRKNVATELRNKTINDRRSPIEVDHGNRSGLVAGVKYICMIEHVCLVNFIDQYRGKFSNEMSITFYNRRIGTTDAIGSRIPALSSEEAGTSIDPRDRNGERSGLRLSYKRIFIMLRIYRRRILYTTHRRGEINGARVWK